MTATGRRATVTPNRYSQPWPHGATVVLIRTATHGRGTRVFDLLVDDVKIGEVEAHPYTRERPIPGSRLVSRGKDNAATLWRVWRVEDGQRVGGTHGVSSTERYWALSPVVRRYLNERGPR